MTRGRDTALSARGRVVGWLAWFVALNLLWLLFISAWVLEEAILGLVAAAVAATAAEAVREQGVAGFRPRVRWLRRVPALPWLALRDSGLVLGALTRHVSRRRPVPGRFRLVPVVLPDDPYEQAAKRALLTAGESFAPNSYVLTIDTRKSLMLTHDLVSEEAP
jgi:hypothetical protein